MNQENSSRGAKRPGRDLFRSLQNRPRTRLLTPMAPPWSNKVSQKGIKRSSKWTQNRPRGIFCGFSYIALTLKRFPCFGGSRGSKIHPFPIRGALRKRVLILICFWQAFSLLDLFFLCFYRKWVKILTRRGGEKVPFGVVFLTGAPFGHTWDRLGSTWVPSAQSHQNDTPRHPKS